MNNRAVLKKLGFDTKKMLPNANKQVTNTIAVQSDIHKNIYGVKIMSASLHFERTTYEERLHFIREFDDGTILRVEIGQSGNDDDVIFSDDGNWFSKTTANPANHWVNCAEFSVNHGKKSIISGFYQINDGHKIYKEYLIPSGDFDVYSNLWEKGYDKAFSITNAQAINLLTASDVKNAADKMLHYSGIMNKRIYQWLNNPTKEEALEKHYSKQRRNESSSEGWYD
jgi:hypothetical protein